MSGSIRSRLSLAAGCGVWCVALLAIAGGAERSARDLLPASTVAYLEVPQPSKALDLVLDHPLVKELEAQPAYQQALRGKEYEQVLKLVKAAEERLGMKWRSAANALTTGGVYVGFDLTTQGVVMLTEAVDEAFAQQARNTLLELARSIAGGEGKPDPVKEDEHRGVKVHEIGDVGIAVCGKWLVVANKRALVWMVLENYASGSASLGADEQFRAVLQTRTGEPAAWLYLDMRVLRLSGGLRKALNKKSNNPPIEIIAGGVIGALPDAPYVTAALELNPARARLAAALPCKPEVVAKTREFYLGPQGKGAAPPLLRPKETLATLATYRDFASLWRHAPDLFDDGVNAKLAEAESGLTTFFAGRNFRDEILGNLEPGLQIVATRQTFPQAGITPAIKLPAGAIVARMKKPEETTRLFKMTFQSVIGFLNVVGAMKGFPPLDLNSEKTGEALVVWGEYLPPQKVETRTEASLHYNASPTVAFVGDKFILASAKPLALELVELVRGETAETQRVNTRMELVGKVAQAALVDNRGQLVAQNMLEKGHGRAAAEQEIDLLLKALLNVESAALELRTDEGRMELVVDIGVAHRR
jgi:hypothetical protein